LLKQHRQLSYQELAFHLEDSASFRAFARLPYAWSPKKSMLYQTISAIRAETWEQINRALLTSARQEKLESGRLVRLDSTVTAALLHEPSDSSLLWDAVRVMVRLLREANELVGSTGIAWRDHRRLAKKRARAIQFTRGRPKRVQLVVPRADQDDPGHLGLSAAGGGAAGHHGRSNSGRPSCATTSR
jgi:IS5 family transposase